MLHQQPPTREQSQTRDSTYQSYTKFRWWEKMVIATAILLNFSRDAQAFVRPSGASARYTWGRLVSAQSLLPKSRNLSPETNAQDATEQVPLFRAEGLFSVVKPVDWTSSNVVSYIRGMLTRDAKERGAKPGKVGSKRGIKVGHGGTLDPLATGVLVIGVGKGTKQLQSYLTGAKRYRAGVELGFETTTLDMEGNITKTASFDHVTLQMVEEALPQFRGTIMQIPPIFSALRVDGKRLYQHARNGVTADDIEIKARQVEIYGCDLIDPDESKLPKFSIDVECGGGTYIRSLIRDIGYEVDSVATTTFLERTQQGQFILEDSLEKDDWTVENICAAIDQRNEIDRAIQES